MTYTRLRGNKNDLIYMRIRWNREGGKAYMRLRWNKSDLMYMRIKWNRAGGKAYNI